MNGQLRLKVGQRTHVGVKRTANEDSLAVPEGIDPRLLEKKGMLYILADGMGGHKAGETASQMTTRTVMQEYYSDPSPDVAQSLQRAIQVANAEIYSRAQSPEYEGMGTTLVAAVLKGDRLFVANVGDSRAYLIHGQRIKQITRDHSWVVEQVRAGIITEEEARSHEHRHLLTRSLGGKAAIVVDLFHEKLKPGDAVLLCSDGLTEEVWEEEIGQIVASSRPQEAANQLVDFANQRGGSDNITAIVIGVVRVPRLALADVLDSIRSSRLAPIFGVIAIAAVLLTIGLSWALVFREPAAPRVPPSPTAPVPEASPTKSAPTPTAFPSVATPTPEAVMPTSTIAPTSTPVPPEPQTFDTDVQKKPIKYALKDGVGLAEQARIFGVGDAWEERVTWAQEIAVRHPEILVSPGNIHNIKRGSSIVVEPLNFGYMIGGRVESFSREGSTPGFDLVLSSSKRYHIGFLDLESVRQQPDPLRNGETVRVFGHLREDNLLEVALIDRYLEEGGRWRNWYFAPTEEGKRLWVYGKLNEWGFGGVEEVRHLMGSDYGKAVAAYGFWQKSCSDYDTIAFWTIEVYFWSETEMLYTK